MWDSGFSAYVWGFNWFFSARFVGKLLRSLLRNRDPKPSLPRSLSLQRTLTLSTREIRQTNATDACARMGVLRVQDHIMRAGSLAKTKQRKTSGRPSPALLRLRLLGLNNERCLLTTTPTMMLFGESTKARSLRLGLKFEGWGLHRNYGTPVTEQHHVCWGVEVAPVLPK